MTIDSKTGMPELPEGYFFRVHPSTSGSKYFYVTIFHKVEKRHFFFWKRTVDAEQIFTDMVYPALDEASILNSAKNCITQWDNWKKRNMNLLGDYPPKKLGA